MLTTFVLLYQKSGQNLSIAGAVKNRKIFVNHQMSVTWIHKFSKYLDLEIQIKRKLESHHSGILNIDRHIFHLHRLIAAEN